MLTQNQAAYERWQQHHRERDHEERVIDERLVVARLSRRILKVEVESRRAHQEYRLRNVEIGAENE